jgi:hypothetical protein
MQEQSLSTSNLEVFKEPNPDSKETWKILGIFIIAPKGRELNPCPPAD